MPTKVNLERTSFNSGALRRDPPGRSMREVKLARPRGNGSHILPCSFILLRVSAHRCSATVRQLSQNGDLKSHSAHGSQREETIASALLGDREFHHKHGQGEI